MYHVNLTNCTNAEKNHYHLKDVWYGFNNTTNLGCMTHLYKKYGSPKTYQDFYNAYISDYEGEIAETHGRNEEYLRYQSQLMAEKDNYKLPLGTYYDYMVKKLIIDTLNGSKKETELAEILNSSGYTTIEPDYYQDTKLGIDKFVYKDGKLICIAQVKPNTFFMGNRNETLINDRISALNKESKVNKEFNVPVIYFIYNRNNGNWIKNEKGGKGHKLTALINPNGTTKKDYTYF